MALEDFIARMTEMRDRAQSDIEAFTHFSMSLITRYHDDGGRLLAHLKATTVSCDELIQKAKETQRTEGRS